MRRYGKPPLAVAACLIAVAAARGESPIAVDDAVIDAQRQRIEIIERASRATIAVFGLDGGGGGSGVIVSADGYALTNYHVSSACGDHMRCGLDDGRVVDAVIVGVDPTGDVSLIRLLGSDEFPFAPLADSDRVRVGQWCFSAGNPFVLATNLQPSISLGIVSGVNRYQYPAGTLLEYADCIQTDAAINPGNSGGPLFNMAGEVIGINGRGSFEKRGRVNVGVGYAISSNQVKYFMGMLASGRLVDHATLGATVSTDASGKVRVSNILSGSDAYRRGLRFGDEVMALADREVRSTNAFKNVLGTLPKDWRVPITVRREGENQTLLVRLSGVHTDQELIELTGAKAPDNAHPPPDGSDESEPESESEPEAEPEPEAESAPGAEPAPGGPDARLVESMLESRPGFANFYFNRQHRQAVWDRLAPMLAGADEATWRLTGTVAGETTSVIISLEPKRATMKVGSRTVDATMDPPLSNIVAARREAGLLLALHALRELLRLGPERMGDSIYLGQVPVYMGLSKSLADQPRHDVLQTLWYDTQVRFHQDPASGLLSLIEVQGDPGTDPIELYLDHYPEDADQGTDEGDRKPSLPGRLRLQYGTEPMLMLEIDSVAIEPVAGEDDEDADRTISRRALAPGSLTQSRDSIAYSAVQEPDAHRGG